MVHLAVAPGWVDWAEHSLLPTNSLLYHVGPPMKIVEKTLDYLARARSMNIHEKHDLADARIYPLFWLGTPRTADPTAEKRSGLPSMSTDLKRRK